MPEVATRLRPTPNTLRQLYVRSGNQCAFPDCDRILVNAKGQWVGQVCHIEAAMPGGQRFNAASTNDKRRAPANLLLMCHEHHVETDAVDEFDVVRLQQIKAEHEERFSGTPVPHESDIEEVVNDIVASTVTDLTERVELHLPQTLARYNAVLGNRLEPEQVAQDIATLEPALNALRRVPVDTRAVFAVAMARSHPGSSSVPLHELEAVTDLSPNQIHLHGTTLERYGIACFSEEGFEFERPPIPILSAKSVGWWAFWDEFTTFCDLTGESARRMINELRFDLLDEAAGSADSQAA